MIKILFVPTDFSDDADKALKYALELARKANAKVIVFNSYEIPYSTSGMIVSVADVLKEDAQRGIEDTLKKIKEWGYSDVAVEGYIKAGGAIALISEQALEKNADLIVMGTKGASGIQEVLIGSNTQGVIQNADVPVLAVPAVAEYKEIEKITFAADYKEIDNFDTLNILKEIANLYNAEIQILNIITKAEDKTKIQDAIEALELEQFLADIKHEYFYQENDDVVNGITEFVDKNSDMVAVYARKHGFLEKIFKKSVTNQLAFHSKKPLLAIKEK
jgi:nucleotide-binding universal stress UspA family protein